MSTPLLSEPRVEAPAAGEAPYVGPRPFPRGFGRFFGRARETIELANCVVAHPAVLLYAMSGAGKTSLINAGLTPMLEADGHEVLPSARMQGPTGGLDPSAIPNVFAFHALMTWAGEGADAEALAKTTLAQFLAGHEPAVGEDGEERLLVAVFDQFEEMFTAYPGRWQDRKSFFQQVAEALAALPSLRVLLAMREDHVAAVDPYAPLLPEKLRTRLRMERLRRAAALEGVVRPLEGTGKSFAPGVAEQLVDDLLKIRVRAKGSDADASATGELEIDGIDEDGNVVGRFRPSGRERPDEVVTTAEYVEPVQLQVVCQTLWEGISPDESTITAEHLRACGDPDKALSAFYERCVREAADASPGLREGAVRRWFEEKLITPAGTRGLVYRGPTRTGRLPNEALDVLVSMHLVRGEDRGGARWYELTHDRFIEPIRESNRRWRASRSEQTLLGLERKAAEWARDRRRSRLLTGEELIKAEAWMAGSDSAELGYSSQLVAFVRESRVSADLASEELRGRAKDRRIKSLWQKLWGLSVAVALTVGLTVVAAWGWISARRNEVQSKLNEAQAGRNADQARANEEKARANERKALDLARKNKEIARRNADLVVRAEREADEAERQMKIAEAEAGKAQVRAAAVRATLLLARHPQRGLAKAAEAARMAWEKFPEAAPSAAAALRRALMESRQRIDVGGDRGELIDLALDPAGRRIAAGGKDGSVRLWDLGEHCLAAEGSLVGELPPRAGDKEQPVNRVAFDASGRRLVVAAGDLRAGVAGASGSARVWDGITDSVVIDLEDGGAPATDAEFSPDGASVVVAGADGKVRLCDAASGMAKFPPVELAGPVNSVAFDRAGGRLAVAYGDMLSDKPGLPGGVRILDAKTGRRVADLRLEAAGRAGGDHVETAYAVPVQLAAFTPDGALVVAACKDAAVRVIEAETGRVVATLLGHAQPVAGLTFSRDGAWLVTASGDRTARVWDAGLWLRLTTHRELTSAATLGGHTASLYSAEFSPDGQRVVTSSYDGTAKVWDARTGEGLIALLGHVGPVVAARFAPDGATVVTAGQDGTARVWDAGRVARPSLRLEGHAAAVRDAAFRPDGKVIATASADRTARLWDAATGKPLADLADEHGRAHDGPVLALAFGPEGTQLVATAGGDGNARVWNSGDGHPIATLAHGGAVTALAFSPDGRFLLTAGSDAKMRLWNAKTWKEVGSPWDGSSARLTPSAFAPKGDRVVTAGAGVPRPRGVKGLVRVWNIEMLREVLARGHDAPLTAVVRIGGRIAAGGTDGAVLVSDPRPTRPAVPPLRHRAAVERLAASPDGRRLAVETADGLGYVWNMDRQDAGPVVLTGLTGPAANLAFSSDGEHLLTDKGRLASDSGDGLARVWDAKGRRLVTLLGRRDAILALAFRPGGRIATVNWENRAQDWDAQTGLPLGLRRGPDYAATAAAISPDGLRVVTGAADGNVQLWDARNGRKFAPLPRHGDRVTDAAFSPDGRFVVTASWDRSAIVSKVPKEEMNQADPPVALLMHKEPVNAARFFGGGSDGPLRVVVACGDRRSALRDVRFDAAVVSIGQETASAEAGRLSMPRADGTPVDSTPVGVNAASFNLAGRRVVLACGDNVARIYDAAAGSEVMELVGHTEPVLDAAFSPKGRFIATASADNTARIWETDTGLCLLELRGHSGDVSSVTFRGDGRYVVTACRQDGTARVWDARTGECLYVLAAHESNLNSAMLGDLPGDRPFTDDVNAAAFSPDGQWVLTANGDGVARVYSLDLCGSLDDLIRLAEARIGDSAGTEGE